MVDISHMAHYLLFGVAALQSLVTHGIFMAHHLLLGVAAHQSLLTDGRLMELDALSTILIGLGGLRLRIAEEVPIDLLVDIITVICTFQVLDPEIRRFLRGRGIDRLCTIERVLPVAAFDLPVVVADWLDAAGVLLVVHLVIKGVVHLAVVAVHRVAFVLGVAFALGVVVVALEVAFVVPEVEVFLVIVVILVIALVVVTGQEVIVAIHQVGEVVLFVAHRYRIQPRTHQLAGITHLSLFKSFLGHDLPLVLRLLQLRHQKGHLPRFTT